MRLRCRCLHYRVEAICPELIPHFYTQLTDGTRSRR
jgi:hypothetical protein